MIKSDFLNVKKCVKCRVGKYIEKQIIQFTLIPLNFNLTIVDNLKLLVYCLAQNVFCNVQ